MLLLLLNETYPKTKFDSALRIYLNGNLDVQDFATLFDSFDSIYKFQFCMSELERFLTEEPKFTFDGFHNERQDTYREIRNAITDILLYKKDNDLPFPILSYVKAVYFKDFGEYFSFELPVVLRTQHSSPGFTDILGIGKILSSFQNLIKYYFPNKKDKESAELMRQERITKQIKNLKAVGFSDIEIREMLLNNDKKELLLKQLIDQRKITETEQ